MKYCKWKKETVSAGYGTKGYLAKKTTWWRAKGNECHGYIFHEEGAYGYSWATTCGRLQILIGSGKSGKLTDAKKFACKFMKQGGRR